MRRSSTSSRSAAGRRSEHAAPPCLNAALAYAEAGYRVFPVRKRGRGLIPPLDASRASTDPKLISAWWKKHPDANVAIATGRGSGIVVVVVKGIRGARTLCELEKKHGSFPVTALAITHRDTGYYFFGCPEVRLIGANLRNGLSLCADGDHVLAPPSLDGSGKVVQWVGGERAGRLPMAPAPGWLLEAGGAQLRVQGEKSPALVERYIPTPIVESETLRGDSRWGEASSPRKANGSSGHAQPVRQFGPAPDGRGNAARVAPRKRPPSWKMQEVLRDHFEIPQECKQSPYWRYVKLTALALLTRWNPKDGTCWPSIETISNDWNLTKEAVIGAIRLGEEIGLVHADRERGKVNRYSFPALELIAEEQTRGS